MYKRQIVTLRIGSKKQDRFYCTKLSDGKSWRISFGGGRKAETTGRVCYYDWSNAPMTWNSKTGEYKAKREKKATKQLRETLVASYEAAMDKHQGIRDRISNRRLAGQQARAEGRSFWYWSEYGC